MTQDISIMFYEGFASQFGLCIINLWSYLKIGWVSLLVQPKLSDKMAKTILKVFEKVE